MQTRAAQIMRIVFLNMRSGYTPDGKMNNFSYLFFMDQTTPIEMRKQKREELKKEITEQSLEHNLKMEMKKDKIELIGKMDQQKMSDLLLW
ncbi:unnamed protein product [Caenorhabditis nigoni]